MRFAVAGIGNRLRGDDAAGPCVIDALNEQNIPGTFLFDCGSAPEAFAGKIIKSSPDYVIIVDAVDMKKPAGFVGKINPGSISGSLYSTHNAPIALFMKALSDACKKIIFIGIQPAATHFGADMSSEAKNAVRVSAAMIRDIIQSGSFLF